MKIGARSKHWLRPVFTTDSFVQHVCGELSLCQVRACKQEHDGEPQAGWLWALRWKSGNQPEGAQGATRASRRGSQTVLGEGTIKESVPEEMNSKRRRWVGVHWLEVEGWRKFAERTACTEPGERRQDRTRGTERLLGRPVSRVRVSGCWAGGTRSRLEDRSALLLRTRQTPVVYRNIPSSIIYRNTPQTTAPTIIQFVYLGFCLLPVYLPC